MINDLFVAITVGNAEPSAAPIPADRVVSGTPATRTWNIEKTPDGEILSGTWEATPGAWRVDYDKWEFCHIVSGSSILRQDGETPKHVSAGDSFVIRPGFKGVWEVVETTRKTYVIRKFLASSA